MYRRLVGRAERSSSRLRRQAGGVRGCRATDRG